MLKLKKLYSFLILSLLLSYNIAHASQYEPMTLEAAMDVELNEEYYEGKEDSSKLDMRFDAMKEVALSYGALSGMVHRNWEILNILERKSIILDTVFNFSRLTIPTHYGAIIEPPIVSESDNAFILGKNGMMASMTSKTYAINENVKIVTSPRNWRDYLTNYMDLESPEKPFRALTPKTKKEKEAWTKNVRIGWTNGVDQANDMFADKLAILLSDYEGMIRYRKLLAQKMISEPLAIKENRGITGNANQINIDDKAIFITNIPSLNKTPSKWEPTER